jgi:hypothetical protein
MEAAPARTDSDRVRSNTPLDILKQIDAQIARNVRYYAAQPSEMIAQRIEELESEWSIERWLELNASAIGFTTLLLALTRNRAWSLLTCTALSFLLLHALQGFDPPLPLLRKMGVRTRGEIDREAYALKALRGDFPATSNPGTADFLDEKAEAALRAVNPS